jgi:sarcosine oxidase subunit beta
MSNLYDVIIVGGGIMGCCAAYELARRGLKVGLFEKRTIGEGPSGRSSAIIRQHYSNQLTARMALHSLHVFQSFDEQLGDECGFTQTGFVVLVEEKDRAGLEANLTLQRGVGIHTELLSREDLSEILPAMVTGDLVAAAYEPESGYADPYLTVNAYARAARRAGATIHQDTEARRIRLEKGHVTGIDTAADRFHGPLVLNCTGAWASGLAATAGVGLPIHSCRVQVAFFRRPLGHAAAHPVVGDFVNAIYFRGQHHSCRPHRSRRGKRHCQSGHL